MTSGLMDFLRSQIGKGSENSPSPLMRWLNPEVLAAEEGAKLARGKSNYMLPLWPAIGATFA